jgi:3-hydroxybutyryl-CoA dehydrogenase
MAVHAIAVIGAGAMGSGIAQAAAVAGLGVTLIEISDATVEKGLDRVRGNLQKLVAKGKMTQADKEAALGSIRGTTALEDVAPADVVIEAVTENYEVKLDLLHRVDALMRAGHQLAPSRSPSYTAGVPKTLGLLSLVKITVGGGKLLRGKQTEFEGEFC